MIISNKTLFNLQSALDCGENWPQGWDCPLLSLWGPSSSRGRGRRRAIVLTFRLLHLDHKDVFISVCYLFYYVLQFFFGVPIWDLQDFLMVLWENAIKVGLSGTPRPLKRSPELEAGALHGSGDTYLPVPHDAVLSVQSSLAI